MLKSIKERKKESLREKITSKAKKILSSCRNNKKKTFFGALFGTLSLWTAYNLVGMKILDVTHLKKAKPIRWYRLNADGTKDYSNTQSRTAKQQDFMDTVNFLHEKSGDAAKIGYKEKMYAKFGFWFPCFTQRLALAPFLLPVPTASHIVHKEKNGLVKKGWQPVIGHHPQMLAQGQALPCRYVVSDPRLQAPKSSAGDFLLGKTVELVDAEPFQKLPEGPTTTEAERVAAHQLKIFKKLLQMRTRKIHAEAKEASPQTQSAIEIDLKALNHGWRLAAPILSSKEYNLIFCSKEEYQAWCEAALEEPTPWDPFNPATPEGQARVANIAARQAKEEATKTSIIAAQT